MQLPTLQQHAAKGTERLLRPTRAGGASAATLAAAGASTLLPAAAAQAQDGAALTTPVFAALTPTPAVAGAESAQTAPVSELAAEPVLLSSFATPAAPTMAPSSIAPLVAPGVVPGTMPAVSILGETSELAQTVTATAPVASEESYESFWPDGHWGDSGSGGWAGIIGTSLSLTGTAAGVGGAYLLWRSLNEAPHFDLPLRYENFEESPRGSAVMTVQAFDDDNDTLEYSIVESLTDDSRLLEINAETGEITFISDPQMRSPGDGDFDGVYEFTVQVEDSRGETDRQTIELTMVPAFVPSFTQTTGFLLPGSSEYADLVQISMNGSAPSLNEISTGLGNDYIEVNGTVEQLGFELGDGEDTIVFNPSSSTSVTLDTGDGIDRIMLNGDVSSLVIHNFGAFDIVSLLGLTNGSETLVYYDNATDAANHLTQDSRVSTYNNGEDSFLLFGTNSASPTTTIKFEDTIITEDTLIIV
jgi:hypothetical protein